MIKPDIQTSLIELAGRIVSLSLPCPDVSLEKFLQLAEGGERFYWENPQLAFAGSGTAIELMAWGVDRFEKVRLQTAELFSGMVMLSETHPLTYPRLFGGFSFSDDFTPDNTWSIYAPAYFVLPHYQLTRIDGEMWLTINTQIPYEEDPQQLMGDLQDALQSKIAELQAASTQEIGSQPHLQDVNYPMTYPIWEKIITSSVQRMKAGELNKVVLSRVCEARFDDNINLLAILRYLGENYAECYRFLFEPRPHHAFYGATPELLAEVQGNKLVTMGLAGSIKRGKTPQEDQQLADELLNSAKDRYEHQLVVDRVRARLEPISDELNIGTVEIYALSNIQHLHTPITATLKSDDGILPVVSILHPTPALGGDPRDIALSIIAESEPVPRGWYAAPVGWIDYNLDGQFAVSIRSAVAQDKRVWMYAGAGIVADSETQKEWDETALKFRPMLNALGISEVYQHGKS